MIDSVLRRLRAAGRSAPSGEAHDRFSRMRAPPVDVDRVLLSPTHLWLRRVPPRIHPKHLCRYHPHLANRLAQCWGDRVRVDDFMNDLRFDNRGGRKGLSQRVRSELFSLERFHALHAGFRRQVAPAHSRPRWPLAGFGSGG